MTTPNDVSGETDVAPRDASSLANAAPTLFGDAQLAAIGSFEDAARLLSDNNVAAEFASDYGTGFKVVDKATLIDKPFLILEWRFNAGDFGSDFVSVAAVTKSNDKVIFNDGSTGVRKQLETVTAQRLAKGHAHPQAGLLCENGLTKTSYYFNSKTGETSSAPQTGDGWGPASTYYIAD